MAVNSFSGQPAIPASYGFTAGKNKIINGDFNINQRGFTSASGAALAQYSFDRFYVTNAGGTYNPSAQTFTPGTAPVTGYESANFLRNATSGQSAAGDYSLVLQRIEDVRTFANQTATISFWAKAGSGTPKIGVEITQNFGSGGSPSAAVDTAIGSVTLSTSWARYSVTVNVPSISGKTLGTTANSSYLQVTFWLSAGSNFATRASSIGIQNSTIDIWGIQVEAGSVATPFQTATGTIQGELAACQRYYWRTVADSAYSAFGNGIASSTTNVYSINPIPVTMRIAPNSLDYSNLAVYDGVTVTAVTSASLTYNNRGIGAVGFSVASGLTQYRPYLILSNNSTSAYLGFSAEL